MGTIEAKQFIRKIRNQGKKQYALAYLNYLDGACREPDHKAYNLSGMGAQAVRNELYAIERPSTLGIKAPVEEVI